MSMIFTDGETVRRERRRAIADPYNPARQIPGSWDDPLDTLDLESCFLDTTSSIDTGDATRSSVSSAATLHCTDPTVDVKAGDRIVRGADIYYVNRRPAHHVNPFTGWSPPLAIPLDLEEG